MTSEQLAALIIDVKNYLDVTWTDTETDKKISGVVSRGIKYIDRVAGSALDYSIEANPRALLFDYCRYGWSNSLDEFSTNYLPEILALEISESVKAYEASLL